MLWLGREGQDAYGRKNFLDLISVFTAPPLFTVLHGRHELGSVDESTFLGRRDDGPPVLLLAGRAWRVSHLDWKRRRAHVEPAEDAGRSRWRGGGQFLGHDLCRAIRRVLAGDAASPGWSRRAVARMEAIRAEYPWLTGDEANVLLAAGDEAAWWTFAGGRANAALAHELATAAGREGHARTTSPSGSRRASGRDAIEPQPWRACGEADPGSSCRRPASRPSTG